MPNAAQRPGAFAALVSGLQQTAAIVRQGGEVDGLHVFLTPLGVRAILGVSSAEIASLVVDLADIQGRAAGELIERLVAVHTWQQRFAVLDRVFARAVTPVSPPREVSWAWRRLAQTHGCMPIQQLAREIGWSRRHFSERFHSELGVAPKTAARIFRFERACRLIRDERPSLAQVAAACGYHDQAHMTREWNAMAGCTPKTWIADELPILQDYELSNGHDGTHERSPS
jgi:AraC-like DNA-binding protein